MPHRLIPKIVTFGLFRDTSQVLVWIISPVQHGNIYFPHQIARDFLFTNMYRLQLL